MPFTPGNEIDDLAHEALGRWLDLSPEGLRRCQALGRQGYRRRKNAFGRALEIPLGEVYTAQARIHDILLRTAPIAPAAHGGVAGRSIMTHARVHLPEARGLLGMDLSQAYQNVAKTYLGRVLRKMLRPMLREMRLEAAVRRQIVRILLRLTTVDGHLPTGGPASAALLNVACGELDRMIEKLVLAELGPQGRYSRYVDDLVITSPRPPLPDGLPRKVENAIYGAGIGRSNRQKTRFLPFAAPGAIEVTGIIHDGLHFAVSPSRMAQIEQSLTAAERGALPLSRKSLLGLVKYIESVYGADRLPMGLIQRIERLLGDRP